MELNVLLQLFVLDVLVHTKQLIARRKSTNHTCRRKPLSCAKRKDRRLQKVKYIIEVNMVIVKYLILSTLSTNRS